MSKVTIEPPARSPKTGKMGFENRDNACVAMF